MFFRLICIIFIWLISSLFYYTAISNFSYQGSTLTIPTPVFHFDAQDVDGDGILYTADTTGEPVPNEFIQTWFDKSPVLGGANNAFQNTADERPQYVTGAINTHPALVFSGINDNFDITNNGLINTGNNFSKRSIGALFRTGNDVDSIQMSTLVWSIMGGYFK